MEVVDILKALSTGTDCYPNEVFEEAYLRLAELKPLLLESLEYACEKPKKVHRSDSILHINALFLLAKARDHDAFPLLVSICRLNHYSLYNLLTPEVMVFYLHRILASVFNGDIDSLKRLLEEKGLLEDIRCIVLKTLYLLVLKGKINRKSTVSYLSNLWDTRHMRHMEVFRYELEDILDLLEGNDSDVDFPVSPDNAMYPKVARMNRGEWEFIDDLSVIIDIYKPDNGLMDLDLQTEIRIMEEVDNIMYNGKRNDIWEDQNGNNSSAISKKIGRNEPCPCGSGKKYKKCCGR